MPNDDIVQAKAKMRLKDTSASSSAYGFTLFPATSDGMNFHSKRTRRSETFRRLLRGPNAGTRRPQKTLYHLVSRRVSNLKYSFCFADGFNAKIRTRTFHLSAFGDNLTLLATYIW